MKRHVVVEEFNNPKRNLLAEDDDESFELTGLIPHLLEKIVEKMPYEDFKTFNEVSRLAAQICETRKEIEAKIRKVDILKEGESFKRNNEKVSERLCSLKDNVRVHSETLEIDKYCLNAIKKHKITAELVYFRNETGSDWHFVKDVLELTKPKLVAFDKTTMETMHLEELKKLEHINFVPRMGFNDEDLLSLKLEAFSMVGGSWDRLITTNGVLALLQEWKAGTRKIRRMEIAQAQNFDVNMFPPAFPGHPQMPSLNMRLCREDGESDVIIDLTYGNVRLRVAPCVGHGVQIPQGPTTRRLNATYGRRRSPPF